MWVWESRVKKKVSVIVRNFTFFTVSVSITFTGVMMSSKLPLAQSPKSSLSPSKPTTPGNPEHTYSTAGTLRLLAPFLASRASFSVMSLSRERLARDGLGQGWCSWLAAEARATSEFPREVLVLLGPETLCAWCLVTRMVTRCFTRKKVHTLLKGTACLRKPQRHFTPFFF